MNQTDFFSIVAERTRRQGPGHVFARFTQDGELTLGDLDAGAQRAANCLADRGVKPGSRVVLSARTCPGLLAALIGIWRLGAMALPVDVFMQPKALAALARRSKADLLVLDAGLSAHDLLAKDEAFAGRVVDLDEVGKVDAEASAPPAAKAGAPALCIFTSGSTGIPKGVVHTLAGLAAGADNVSEGKGYTEADTILCVLPLSHLNGLMTTFLGPLLGGYDVVYLQENFTPEAALDAVERFGCTVFSATPTQYALLAGAGTSVSRKPVTLRFCRSASAPLSEKVHLAFEERYGVPIVETMGTSETAGQIFTNPMPPGKRKVSSVGLPIGFEIRLVDDQGRDCAPCERGEIVVRGAALMAGYLDDPEETAKVVDQDGWFRTGDIAYADPDGYHFIVGRKKDIIIYCGVNVSLPQIERMLRESPLVGDAALAPRAHEVFGETFEAFVIPAEGRDPSEEDALALYEVMRQELPNPQCLTGILFVKEFPRSSVGKVLKGRLEPEAALFRWSRAGDSTDVMAFVAEVLEVDVDRIHEDLIFGGIPEWDSMAYLAMLAAVETVLDRTLDPDEMDQIMSVKGIRSLIEGGDEAATVGVYDYGLHL